MKKVTGLLAKSLLTLVICASLSSFANWGGDHFEIYLDKKLVFRQYLHMSKEAGVFNLDNANPEAQVDVYYGHCGQTGKSRTLIVKDAKDNILKKFEFADASGSNKFMSCKVKDITGIQKKIPSKLYVYYSSKELPQGKLVATVAVPEKNVAAR